MTLALPRERHGHGLGRLALGLGTGLAVGPLIGGALVEAYGWRSVFLYRAPVAGVLALIASATLPRGRRAGAWRLPPRAEWLRWAVLSGLGLAALSNGAQFAVWLLAPFYLVRVLGLDAAHGGMFFMLTPLATASMSPLAGRLTDLVGSRVPMALGLVMEAAGLLVMSRFTADTPYAEVAVGLALVGAGGGLCQVPNPARLMASSPAARQGAAAGLAFMSRTLGVVAGVQATGAVFGALERPRGCQAGFAAAFVLAGAVCVVAAVIAAIPSGRGRYDGDAGADPGGRAAATTRADLEDHS